MSEGEDCLCASKPRRLIAVRRTILAAGPVPGFQEARQVRIPGFTLCICAATAMLPGCGGTQPPTAAPGSMPKNISVSAQAAARGAQSSKYKILFTFNGINGTFP